MKKFINGWWLLIIVALLMGAWIFWIGKSERNKANQPTHLVVNDTTIKINQVTPGKRVNISQEPDTVDRFIVGIVEKEKAEVYITDDKWGLSCQYAFPSLQIYYRPSFNSMRVILPNENEYAINYYTKEYLKKKLYKEDSSVRIDPKVIDILTTKKDTYVGSIDSSGDRKEQHIYDDLTFTWYPDWGSLGVVTGNNMRYPLNRTTRLYIISKITKHKH